jgi:hypothetical protein
VPAPLGPDTVAVNVTDWPTSEGLADELKLVVVGAGTATALTTCVKGADELAR